MCQSSSIFIPYIEQIYIEIMSNSCIMDFIIGGKMLTVNAKWIAQKTLNNHK